MKIYKDVKIYLHLRKYKIFSKVSPNVRKTTKQLKQPNWNISRVKVMHSFVSKKFSF